MSAWSWPHRADAEADESRGGIRIDPERLDRQVGDGGGGRRAVEDRPAAVARPGPGQGRVVGDGEAVAEAQPAEAGGEIGEQALLAAEEMRRARDVEAERGVRPWRRVDGDQRRVAQAGQGEAFEKAPVGFGCGRGQRQLGQDGARIGKAQAGGDAQFRGGLVHGMQCLALGARAVECEGLRQPRSLPPGLEVQPVDRQVRELQRKIASGHPTSPANAPAPRP